MTTTLLDLAAIKAQLDTITQGQWQWDSYSERLEDAHHNWLGNIHMDEDAAFVVSAAETTRALVAEVERLQRENEHLIKERNELADEVELSAEEYSRVLAEKRRLKALVDGRQ